MAYAGWTGLQSGRKTAPLSGRGIAHSIRNGSYAAAGPGDDQLLEIDRKFGQLLGLLENQKVGKAQPIRVPSTSFLFAFG